ncbi:MAG: PAS domain-containing protein [Gemmatimonadaceae bacterium]|jgi:PAS domain S-box-containing protein|nr:PAS domain-containing protein [Gemmatimonadaceae bacterium]
MTVDPPAPTFLPLEQRVRLLEQVVIQAHEAIVITEAEPLNAPGPRIVYVNDAFTRLTGYSAVDVLGRSPRLFQTERTSRATLDEIRRCLSRWAPFRGEVLNRHKDGSDVWIDLSIVPVVNEVGWFTHWVAIQRDVTEARRNREALAHSEAKLRLALRAARMGTWNVDVTTGEVTWSEELYELMCRDPALGPPGPDSIAETTEPAEAAELLATIARVRRDGTPGAVQFRVRRYDGEWRSIDLTVSGVADETGTVTQLTGIVRDITDLVGAERNAVAAASRLRGAQRLARLGVWDVDLEAGTATWSPEMCALFQRDPSRGAPTFDEFFTTLLLPDDAAAVRESLTRVATTQREESFEHRVRREDGTVGEVRSIAEPGAIRDGRVISIKGVTLDVTEERRQAEQLKATNAQLASAQRLVGLGAWTFDLAARRARWSPEMFTIFGLPATTEPLPYEASIAATHPDDRAYVHETLMAAAQQGTPLHLEYRFIRGDGEERIATAFGQAVRDAAGRIVAVTGAILDVTEQRRGEQRLVELKEAAEAAARAKSQFLAKVSHELRTPMNGVLGTLDLLRETALDGDQRQLAKMAHDSAESLLRLLNDLLDFAKIEAGKIELREESFPIRRTVHGVVELLDARARTKGLTLAADVADALPVRILGDEGRLRQVLLNLVGNAIKFTEHGGVRVNVTTVAHHDTTRLRVEVVDSGIGIPPARRAALFVPFSQVHDAARVAEGGAGLGLSICRELIEQMGGSLGLDETQAHGSCFFFELPLRPAEDVRTPSGTRVDDLDGLDLSRLVGAHVLIAEDHPINRAVVQRHVESLGARVSLAVDGGEAVISARSHAFDAILMDWQMPVLDGLSAARQIRADEAACGRRPVPIIAVTANVYEADRAATVAAGMNGFVAKPLVRRELAAVLSRVLAARGRSAHDTLSIFPVTARPEAPPVVPASSGAPDPSHPLAALRRLVHDLANAVQAQDLAWFHRGAQQAAAEADRVDAPDVATASRALLAITPTTEDDWDDVVTAVRAVQQAMRAVKARVDGEAR